MKVRESIQISAPAHVVWKIVAHEFEDVGKWASDVSESVKITSHDLLDGADVAGRVCTSQYGDIKEGFIHFDEAGMTFTYDAEGDAVPFFVKYTTNTWHVEVTGERSCIVSFQPEVTFLPVLGVFLSLSMRLFMRKVLRYTLEELKHYVETGEVHPRKARSMAKTLRKVTV